MKGGQQRARERGHVQRALSERGPPLVVERGGVGIAPGHRSAAPSPIIKSEMSKSLVDGAVRHTTYISLISGSDTIRSKICMRADADAHVDVSAPSVGCGCMDGWPEAAGPGACAHA